MASQTVQRADIQGLRAFAALAVLGYHFFPNQVSGGFVGVDAFFVISGFLITTQLQTSFTSDGGIRLVKFYARRIRRLLPAAYLVLAATIPTAYWLLSPSRWGATFSEIIASALYGENWLLAANSVDYLAAENAPSAVQHYWSLSAEGQIYLVWPLLLVLALWVVRAHTERRSLALRVTLSVVLAVSFAWCILQTYSPTASVAYFSTFTRVWEFALGGVCTLIPSVLNSGRVRVVVSLAGWGLLAAAVFVTDGNTVYPGWMPLLPTLGTAIVIFADDNGPNSLLGRLIAWRPIQYLGDISYPIYLWHWPIVVLILPELYDFGIERVPAKLLCVGVTLVLAGLTYRFVETPIRLSQLFKRPAPTYITSLVALTLIVAACIPAFVLSSRSALAGQELTDSLLDRNAPCFGADATLGDTQPCVNEELDGVLLPDIINRFSDADEAYECFSDQNDSTLSVCSFGSDSPSATRLALVGDSHAGMLVPALKRVAARYNWRVTVVTGWDGGFWVSEPSGEDTPRESRMRQVSTLLLNDEPFDVVIVTQARQWSSPVQDLVTAWNRLTARGTKVLAVVDNPVLPQANADCVGASYTVDDLGPCAMTPDEAWAFPEHYAEAATLAEQGVTLADFSSAYCQGDVCPVVIGHVLVYSDAGHITATWAKTLAPYLAAAIQEALDH